MDPKGFVKLYASTRGVQKLFEGLNNPETANPSTWFLQMKKLKLRTERSPAVSKLTTQNPVGAHSPTRPSAILPSAEPTTKRPDFQEPRGNR